MLRMKKTRVRPWADLPTDILSSIADRLGIIELLGFRGTCKDFRRASYNASARLQSYAQPWLFIHRHHRSSSCRIYNHKRSKAYIVDFPELEDSIFLASYQGWLLVLKRRGSIFFFSPFSRAKIVLPHLPCKQFTRHPAAFSSLPTSPHCIVSVMTPNEVIVISKGESAWTRHKVPKSIRLCTDKCSIVTFAAFDHNSRTFYYVDDYWPKVLTFSVKDNKVNPYPREDAHKLPFCYVKDPFSETIKYNKIKYKSDPLNLHKYAQVEVCGCTLGKVLGNSRQQLIYPNEVDICYSGDVFNQMGVWIQPRFFTVHPDHHW
ncbi:F-box domain-containing protein [Artemisia annua]|uniref:F-box domain-containing protein n=1 Tax=Artemisia annua TaxID=35608 RepID=A0A2U1L6Q4_ARTAN|nr:F-box domain-containing protein [Artemisia annua]